MEAFSQDDLKHLLKSVLNLSNSAEYWSPLRFTILDIVKRLTVGNLNSVQNELPNEKKEYLIKLKNGLV